MTTTTTLGEQMAPEFRPAQNFGGTAIPIYSVVKYDGSNPPDGVVVTTADTERPMGVAAKEIAKAGGDGTTNTPDYGDVVVRGRCRVKASGVIGARVRIAPDSSGRVKAAASGDMAFGESIDAAATDGDIIMAEIDVVNAALVA